MADSAITFTSDEVSTYYAVRVPHLKQRRATEWRGACPLHDGEDDNFAVNAATGNAFCHSQCKRGWDILALEQALNGTDFKKAKAEVFQLVGRIEPQYQRNATRRNGNLVGTAPAKPRVAAGAWREIARYPYVDRNGSLLFEVVRYLKPDGNKVFRQCRPDGHGGVVWNLGDIQRVPYRLPRLLSAETVYLPEGEKDVHALEEWGLAASCNPGGSGNSHLYAGWTDYFRGRDVVILPDNDGPGRKHAAEVAEALLSVAASVRVVELPGLPAKGDVTDWRNAGGTFERFRELTEAAVTMDNAAISELWGRWGLLDEEHQRAQAGTLATRRLSAIDAKPVSWLWQGRIARGKVSIIAGNPGLGKSQLTASIAAVVTTGGLWPVDRQRCEAGNVIFLNAEDDPADTLRPRLEAAGADLERVHFVDGVIVGYPGNSNSRKKQFSLEEDLQALGKTLDGLGSVAVVVIDPITAYLGNTDSHKNAEVRALLAPLSELAARHNTAIIGVSHLTKASGPQALMRVSGSLAFVAAARAAYLVTADLQDKSRRLFLPMKNNIGPDDKGLAFHIEAATVQSPAGPLSTSLVMWESQPVSVTADEVMQSEMGPQNTSALTEAKEWLLGVLADGPVSAAKVTEMAKADGITAMTLRRAAQALSVTKEKPSMKGGWWWSILPKALKLSEDVQVTSLSTFGNLEHLREPEEVVEVEL